MLLCSHSRVLSIYNEVLACNCTFWGVVPNGRELSDRYFFTYLLYKKQQSRLNLKHSQRIYDRNLQAMTECFYPLQTYSTYLLTYLLTPWCRVLLEKLTGLQLLKKFPAFHGTRRFITALTNVRQLSLSWASPIQSIDTHPTFWRSILILFTHLRLGLPSGLIPSGFPTKTLYTPSLHPYAPHAQPISFFSILSPAQYWVRSTSHLAPRYTISSIPPLPRPS